MMNQNFAFVAAVAVLAAIGGCSEQSLVSEVSASQPGASVALAGAGAEPPPDVDALPAGEYRIDPSHASLVFRVDHMGFSNYTAQFRRFDATLQLDPKRPSRAALIATIDPASLDLVGAPDGFLDDMLGPVWLDAGAFPEMTYRSTRVTMTSARTAQVLGDFTFRGLTRPVELDVKFNGGYPGQSVDPHARIGFSATGVLQRSAFGVSNGIPTPPSKMGVADDVRFRIEAEFLGPAWQDAQ